MNAGEGILMRDLDCPCCGNPQWCPDILEGAIEDAQSEVDKLRKAQRTPPEEDEILRLVREYCEFGGTGAFMRDNLPTLYAAEMARKARG